jgi:hypothetical protein
MNMNWHVYFSNGNRALVKADHYLMLDDTYIFYDYSNDEVGRIDKDLVSAVMLEGVSRDLDQKA